MKRHLLSSLLGLLTLSSPAFSQYGSQGDYPAYSGQKSICIIMLSWKDRACPATRQTMADRIWNNETSVRNYFLDMSRGAFEFVLPAGSSGGVAPASTPDIYGPYELSIAAGFDKDVTYANADDYYGGRLVKNVKPVAEQVAAANDGFVRSNYDYIMYVTPKTEGTGGTGGYAGYGARYSHMFDVRQNYLNHELGHNFFLAHSNTGIDSNNYSSQDSVMGNSNQCHIDGPQTYQLGWYPDASFGLKSYGQYEIENLAKQGSDNLKVLRFDRAAHGATNKADYNLWVEYRIKGVDQDGGLNNNWNAKMNIHYCAPKSSRPGDPSVWWDHYSNNVGKYLVGGEYTDPDSVCTARFLRKNTSNGSAIVQLIDPSGNQPPSIANGQHFYVAPGTSDFTLIATDADNDDLSYTIVSGPAHGTLNNTGSLFTYTGSNQGSYSFTVRVNDGVYDSFDVTIPLTLTGAGEPTVNAGPDQTIAMPNPDDNDPGLWFGEVDGNINVSTPNPKTIRITNVASKTEDSIAGSTTEIFTGQIYDADGSISFTENIDDKTRIWIDGNLVISSDTWNNRVSTANLNLTPGWHDIEIRISNGSGGSGPDSGIGIGYDPDGGTAWQTLVDPGDGSLLRAPATSPVASLSGTASDADSAVIMSSWSVVSTTPSGLEGDVTFADTSSPVTTASFSVAGEYTLRLTTTDGLTTVSDDVVITVDPPELTTYQTWAGGGFSNTFTDIAMGSNPDGDKRSNMMEFAFGTDPTLVDGGSMAADGSRHGDPLSHKAEGGEMVITYLRRKDHATAGIAYTVYFSSDLINFLENDEGTNPPIEIIDSLLNAANYELVRVPYPAGSKFGYIQVEPTP